MGRIVGMGCCAPFWGNWHPHLIQCAMWPGPRPTSVPRWHLDPPKRLATIHQRYKTDRQQSDRIGRTILQTVAQKSAKFRVWDKLQERITLIFGVIRIPLNIVQNKSKVASVLKTCSIRSSVLIEHRFVTDRQTDRHRAIAYTTLRKCVASRRTKYRSCL